MFHNGSFLVPLFFLCYYQSNYPFILPLCPSITHPFHFSSISPPDCSCLCFSIFSNLLARLLPKHQNTHPQKRSRFLVFLCEVTVKEVKVSVLPSLSRAQVKSLLLKKNSSPLFDFIPCSCMPYLFRLQDLDYPCKFSLLVSST